MRKYVKTFEQFDLGISNLDKTKFGNKKYNNIDNIVDGEVLDYYQVPFSLGYEDGSCVYDSDGWAVCLGNYFVYDYISDQDITKALKEDLSKINISNDWTNYSSNLEDNFKENHKLRIAKLVQEIQSGKKIKPVSMYFDVMSSNYDIKNHIEDGNHRIRALQFLKFDYYPAFIYGSHAELLINFLKD